MKVKDLMRQLSFFDENDEIYIAQPSYDYWGNVCAKSVGDISIQDVSWSDYHNAYKIIDEERMEIFSEYHDNDELKQIVVLS